METVIRVLLVLAAIGLLSLIAGLGVVRLFRAVERQECEPFGGRE